MNYQIPTDAKKAERYCGVERRLRKPVLELRLRDMDEESAANHMLTVRRTEAEGAGLFVTPNIQHVALSRKDAEFAQALHSAHIAVADGFPVYLFAKWRGLTLPGRVTGRGVIERMFADPAALAGHRGFFVVDSADTAERVTAWLAELAPQFAVATHVPPFGFDADPAYCLSLVDTIRGFDTTLLFLCIGAPKSELFAFRHSAVLPPCWALCVGQSFRLLVGTTAPPPAIMVRLNLEWFWRILLEPRRMLQRYGPSSIGFLSAVLSDLRRAQ